MTHPLAKAYTDTLLINQAAGHIPNGGWEAVDHQMKIVTEEWKEMVAGITTRDVTEFRDGLGDLLFTLMALGWRAGLPMLEDLTEVIRSNYSKYDLTPEDAELTHAKYAALDVVTHYHPFPHPSDPTQTLYVTFSSHDQMDNQGKHYFRNKWLKSHRFSPVALAPLPDDCRLVD